MVGTIGESCGLTNTVVVDTIVGYVRLVGEGRPGTEYKRVLAHSLHRLSKIDRHKSPRHLRVGLFLSIVLLAAEVTEVLREQFTTANPATVVVQIVVNELA